MKAKNTLQKPWKHPLKARFLNLYYEKMYIDCYHFSQQYKDYFDIAGTTGSNYLLFITFLLVINRLSKSIITKVLVLFLSQISKT